MDAITKQIHALAAGVVKGPVDVLKDLSQEELMYLMYDTQISQMLKLKESDPANSVAYDQQIKGLTTGLNAIRPSIKTEGAVKEEKISDYLLSKIGLPGNPGIQIIQAAYVRKVRGE